MKLVVDDKTNTVDYGFCVWLISQLKNEYRLKVNPKKYAPIDAYIDSLEFMSAHNENANDIVWRGFNELTIKRGTNSYTIQINPNMWFDVANKIKLSSMCSLINFGTLAVKGYPIITDIFDEAANHIDALVYHYNTYIKR